MKKPWWEDEAFCESLQRQAAEQWRKATEEFLALDRTRAAAVERAQKQHEEWLKGEVARAEERAKRRAQEEERRKAEAAERDRQARERAIEAERRRRAAAIEEARERQRREREKERRKAYLSRTRAENARVEAVLEAQREPVYQRKELGRRAIVTALTIEARRLANQDRMVMARTARLVELACPEVPFSQMEDTDAGTHGFTRGWWAPKIPA